MLKKIGSFLVEVFILYITIVGVFWAVNLSVDYLVYTLKDIHLTLSNFRLFP